MLAPYVSAKTVAVGGCLALLSGVLVATASADQAPLPGRLVAASELGRAPLPAGDADRSVAGLERSALRLAAALDAVPVREGGAEEDRYCPAASLRVQWTAPAPTYAVGAHLDPVGPAPDDRTAAVNGVVVCDGAGYAYMGFEAHWSGAAWVVTAVPSLSDEHGEHEEEHAEEAEAHAGEAHAEEHGHEEPTLTPPAAAPAPPAPAAGLPGLGTSAAGAVDPYARYDPQRTCDPVAKPGTSALSAMLLRTYPASRSLGLSRTCTARGVSEHKEGRAFDWGVNVGVPAQRAAAESALSQLLATDAAGHRHALARRLGVMYLIWDRKIWSAYNATAGWRPYTGASPHTDHVHISLSWDGAMGRTSYWQGANASLLQLDPALQLAFDGGSGGSGSGGSGGSLPVAPVAHAPAPAGTAPQRRGGRDRKGHDDVAVAPAPEQGHPAAGAVEPLPGAHREEREQRRKARKEGKRREREAQEAAAAAAAEAAAAAAAAAEAQVQAAAMAAASAVAEQAAAPAAAAPAPRRSAGKPTTTVKGKGKGKAAAAPAPAEPPRASGKGSGGGGKARAPEVAKRGKGSAKGSSKGTASAPSPAAAGKRGGGGKGGGGKGGGGKKGG